MMCENMTKADKKRVLLDFMKKATQIVENYKQPYSDKTWVAFEKKTNELLSEIDDKEIQTFCFWLMSKTADVVNMNLNESEDEE